MGSEFRRFIPGFLLKHINRSAPEETQVNISGITPEIAQDDLDNITTVRNKWGIDAAPRRVEEVIIQDLGEISRRLNDREILVYLNGPDSGADHILPTVARTTIKGVVTGEMTVKQGRRVLTDAVPGYTRAFLEAALFASSQ